MKASRSISVRTAAFTLLELLVSTAIISLLVVILVGVTNQISQTWRYTANKVEEFQEARDGFESMTRRLSQATLQTYWGTQTSIVNGISVPVKYIRQSELRFLSSPMTGTDKQSLVMQQDPVSKTPSPGVWQTTHGVFFEAPLGMVSDTTDLSANANLLNTWGYFLEVAPDMNRPTFLGGDSDVPVPRRFRSRLMELMAPAEINNIYDMVPPNAASPLVFKPEVRSWFTLFLPPPATSSTASPRPVRVLAENILALIILPKLSPQDEATRKAAGFNTLLTPTYQYDSTRGVILNSNGAYDNNPGAGDSSTEKYAPVDINPGNQLPPVVEVTMIAIDEQSAQRLASAYPKDGTFGGLNTLANGGNNPIFTNASLLETNPNGLSDLAFYEQVLTGASAQTPNGDPNPVHSLRLNYRIFTTNVTIRGAKWSSTHFN